MKRRTAREYAVQSLYQMEMNDNQAPQAVHMVINEGHDNDEPAPIYDPEHIEFVLGLVKGTSEQADRIDALLPTYLKGWQMDRLSRVDRQILRLAVYELLYTEDTPPKVILNEAIELAKHFGTEESGKFVNGVLGKMVQELDKLKSERTT